jgi:hypothetical protein
VELGPKRRLVRDKLPVAIDFAGVLNTYGEFTLKVDEDVTNVLLWQG